MKNAPMHFFRRYVIAGLLVWLPIWATLLVLRFIIELLDSTLSLLPKGYQPQNLIGFNIPGLGVVVSVLIVFFTGMLVTNFLGKKLVVLGEALVDRIPLVRSIYNAVKQVAITIFSKDGQSFRKVFLVQYPRKGMWSIAFQTGACADEVEHHVGVAMITVFIPTTPNPTSGFLMMVPREDAVELKMTVDQALKLVISLGVVQPQLDLPTASKNQTTSSTSTP